MRADEVDRAIGRIGGLGMPLGDAPARSAVKIDTRDAFTCSVNAFAIASAMSPTIGLAFVRMTPIWARRPLATSAPKLLGMTNAADTSWRRTSSAAAAFDGAVRTFSWSRSCGEPSTCVEKTRDNCE